MASLGNDIDTNKNHKEIEIGLDFILYHLEEPTIFPRTIMTKKLGYQRKVYSKERMLEHFIDSDFIDCRINAFPSLKEGATWPPNLLFIDLDLADFNSFSSNNNNSKKSLKLALDKTLKNIKEKLEDENAHPSVLWSGNGYHIILPVYCPTELERIQEFQEFNNPSERFLRFAKDYLSNGKADKSNNPSFRSCLLRIPNSFNSKCLDRGESFENSKVKIIQEWSKKRPSIKYLLRDFRRYLITLKIQINKDKDSKKAKQFTYKYGQNNNDNNNYKNNTIFWIEKLLKKPVADFRKNSVSLILAPYLVNVKKLSYQESFDILMEWLKKCDSIRNLDFNSRYLVKSALNTASQKRIPPMKLETLRNRNLELFSILQKQTISP
ncbi:MAG TPA: DNA primase noncatalytic subunit PriX [Nitrososphaeraceae archaeon]|nr:DNA primase noncatalytic subunit PriX [Nitrososphaeraceae archaeon]